MGMRVVQNFVVTYLELRKVCAAPVDNYTGPVRLVRFSPDHFSVSTRSAYRLRHGAVRTAYKPADANRNMLV